MDDSFLLFPEISLFCCNCLCFSHRADTWDLSYSLENFFNFSLMPPLTQWWFNNMLSFQMLGISLFSFCAYFSLIFLALCYKKILNMISSSMILWILELCATNWFTLRLYFHVQEERCECSCLDMSVNPGSSHSSFINIIFSNILSAWLLKVSLSFCIAFSVCPQFY